jgi:hypothetical protein
MRALCENDEKRIEQIAEDVRSIKKRIETPKVKDKWDKLSAVSPLVAGILVAAIGTSATFIYNERRLELNEIELVSAYFAYLVSDTVETRELAWNVLTESLEDPILVATLNKYRPDPASKEVLTRLASHPDVKVQEEAREALEEILELVPAALRQPRSGGARRNVLGDVTKQLTIALKMYRMDYGVCPPISGEPGFLFFDTQSLVPELIDEEFKEGLDYLKDDLYYLGYVLENEEQGLAFIEMHLRWKEEERTFDEDIPVEEGLGTDQGNLLLRLGKPVNAEKVMALFEGLKHKPKSFGGGYGGNVLFLDGTVEWRWLGQFPYTEQFLEGLARIRGQKLQETGLEGIDAEELFDSRLHSL